MLVLQSRSHLHSSFSFIQIFIKQLENFFSLKISLIVYAYPFSIYFMLSMIVHKKYYRTLDFDLSFVHREKK